MSFVICILSLLTRISPNESNTRSISHRVPRFDLVNIQSQKRGKKETQKKHKKNYLVLLRLSRSCALLLFSLRGTAFPRSLGDQHCLSREPRLMWMRGSARTG